MSLTYVVVGQDEGIKFAGTPSKYLTSTLSYLHQLLAPVVSHLITHISHNASRLIRPVTRFRYHCSDGASRWFVILFTSTTSPLADIAERRRFTYLPDLTNCDVKDVLPARELDDTLGGDYYDKKRELDDTLGGDYYDKKKRELDDTLGGNYYDKKRELDDTLGGDYYDKRELDA